MNAKKIFTIIAAFFVGIFAFIGRAILQSKRGTTNSNRDRIDECKKRAEQQQSNNRNAIEGIDGAIQTIQSIRKNQQIQN